MYKSEAAKVEVPCLLPQQNDHFQVYISVQCLIIEISISGSTKIFKVTSDLNLGFEMGL